MKVYDKKNSIKFNRSKIGILGLAAMLALPTVNVFGRAAISGGYKFFDASNEDSIPLLISQTGMYKNILTKEINTDVVPFEVNAPLWTDGAYKERFVAIPAGTSIIYSDTGETYVYPDRAFVIKNFSVDTIPGNASSRILWETRFSEIRVVNGIAKTYLFSYRWKQDQSDADLVVYEGETALVRVWKNGLSGRSSMKKWIFPGRVQCAACHRVGVNGSVGGRTVLAFFTAQLNKPLSKNPSVNQLDHLFDIGILKTADGKRPDFTKAVKWANLADTNASLDLRARSYIAANCSGCHGTTGIKDGATPFVTLDYDFHTMVPKMDFVTKKLTYPFPALDSAGLVVPGHPERSVIIYRQMMRNQEPGSFTPEKMAMPWLGSYEPDTNAIKMLSAWITSMPSSSGIRNIVKSNNDHSLIRIHGQILEMPISYEGKANSKYALVALNGKKTNLIRMQPGIFRIENKTENGIHFLVVNNRIVLKFNL